jgi:phospholipase C
VVLTLAACADAGADRAPASELAPADPAPAAPPPPVADAGDARDAAPACPSPLRPDPLLAARTACTFAPGALPGQTIGITEAERRALPIHHVIVVMKENRSFDHLLGALSKMQPDAETFPPTFSNKDWFGADVHPFHFDDTCYHKDPNHSWDAMHRQVNGGKMDGYVQQAALTTFTDGHFALGTFDETDFPFYYFLASTYAVADHYFSSVRGPTYPNRDYLVLATSDHVTETQPLVYPGAALPSIFDRLDGAGVSWGVYAADHPFEEALDDPNHDWETLHPWKKVDDFLADVASGSLPAVTYVDSRPNREDDHPYSDIQVGEAWLKKVYDTLVASPIWPDTVLLVTYDEAGGFFDHVPPPKACVPLPGDDQFDGLGTRVPMMAISRWARRHYVSKRVHEHTSIVRFIEALHGLPALTARDANSDALLDMFDFDCAPAAIPPAPEAGTGRCKLTADAGAPADAGP